VERGSGVYTGVTIIGKTGGGVYTGVTIIGKTGGRDLRN